MGAKVLAAAFPKKRQNLLRCHQNPCHGAEMEILAAESTGAYRTGFFALFCALGLVGPQWLVWFPETLWSD